MIQTPVDDRSRRNAPEPSLIRNPNILDLAVASVTVSSTSRRSWIFFIMSLLSIVIVRKTDALEGNKFTRSCALHSRL